VIRGDDDRGYAVAAARRAARWLVVVRRRQRFDPELAAAVPTGKLPEEVERLGEHVIARHRLELGNVERGQNVAQRLHPWAAIGSAGAGRRLDGVAGVEQDGAALLHVG